MALATALATFRSRSLPSSMVFRRDLYTSLGSRSCMTSSLNTELPNSSGTLLRFSEQVPITYHSFLDDGVGRLSQGSGKGHRKTKGAEGTSLSAFAALCAILYLNQGFVNGFLRARAPFSKVNRSAGKTLLGFYGNFRGFPAGHGQKPRRAPEPVDKRGRAWYPFITEGQRRPSP